MILYHGINRISLVIETTKALPRRIRGGGEEQGEGCVRWADMEMCVMPLLLCGGPVVAAELVRGSGHRWGIRVGAKTLVL